MLNFLIFIENCPNYWIINWNKTAMLYVYYISGHELRKPKLDHWNWKSCSILKKSFFLWQTLDVTNDNLKRKTRKLNLKATRREFFREILYNNIAIIVIQLSKIRRNQYVVYYHTHSKNIDKSGKNSWSARRKPNYHTKCGKNYHKILSV